jgi:hypothetical protein
MNTKKAWALAGTALGAGLLATTILLWNENQQLRQEREALRAAADQPGAQNAEPAPAQIAPEELARLKATESEVLRLRNQVSLLRKELAQSKAAQGQKQPTEAATPLTPTVTNEVPGVFEAKLNASIPEDQTLAFGGWMTESGKRAVAFVYPTIQGGSGTNTQMLIRTTLMEVPPEVWSQLGLADIKADPQLSSQSGLVSQQQAESLIASLTNQPECLILNRPIIQTSDGMQASLFVGQITDSNEQKGLSLDCLPQLGPDGRSIHLSLGMKVGSQGPAAN